MSFVHVRYDGQSIDMTFDDLDIGLLSSDGEVKSAVAESLNVPVVKLASFVVDRPEGDVGDLTLRPQAVFG